MATSEIGRVGAYQRLSSLPAFHPAAVKLLAISDESESAMSDFEEVFKADLSLTTNLLLVANSAAFGVQRQIDTIRHALTLLGRMKSPKPWFSWHRMTQATSRESS